MEARASSPVSRADGTSVAPPSAKAAGQHLPLHAFTRLQKRRPAWRRPFARAEPSEPLCSSKLLLGGDRVLGGLGDAELHHRLGLDLNGFAGLRVASYAGLEIGRASGREVWV